MNPPREDLIRATPRFELRDDEEVGPVMSGHFAVFDSWTEIDSIWEGKFMERIAPGAFKKTFKENRAGIRALFQHGYDPQIGDKPLGPIRSLEEDTTGAYYEVPLLDAPYVRDGVLPGLQAGLYGASFRMKVINENFDEEPGTSEHNPLGLPERTIQEAKVFELSAVTFPAYKEATAAVRSLTDEFRAKDVVSRLKHLLEELPEPQHSKEEPATEQPEGSEVVTPETSRSTRQTEPISREAYIALLKGEL